MNLPDKLTIGWLKENYLNNNITPGLVMDQILENTARYREMNIWITKPDPKRLEKYLSELGPVDFDKKPLWGIPFAIKDNIDLAGVPTTAGCEAYQYMPDENAAVVERLVEAGAIPLGKTNMDQFATGLVGTRSPYGEVHNSCDGRMISGGSSAGSAVAVAMGIAAFALGTDTAGSGRVPAALNNLTGFKPTVGAWPLKGVVPACASLDCVTVFAHSIKDAMMVDQAARGYDREDRWSKRVIRKPAKMPDTIYIPKDEPEFYGEYKNLYEKAWHRSVKWLESTGVKVVKTDLSFYGKAAGLLYEGPCVAERWADLGEFVASHREDIFPVTRTVLETGSRDGYTAQLLYKTMHQLMEYKRRSNNLLDGSVMVLPTCAGTYTRDEVRQDPITTNSNMGKYTNHCNLLDMCAAAVPAGYAAEKLPFGISVFGTNTGEHLVCALAECLEKVKIS